jgi:hypothetical protein
MPEVLGLADRHEHFRLPAKTGQAKKIPGELDVGHFGRTLGEFDVDLGALGDAGRVHQSSDHQD